MAEKKEHKIVSASGGARKTDASRAQAIHHNVRPAPARGNAGGRRAGAVILWLLAIVCEVLAILIISEKFVLQFLPTMYQIIGFLVLDLIFVIIGAQLWKSANRIDPASRQNKAKFWLWNNMGVIACIVAFVPIIVIMLSNKDLDKRTKAICTVVAVIALLIGGLASYDWSPISAEEKDELVQLYGDDTVYWTPYGKVYHTNEYCHTLNHSETLYEGTVDEAVENNRTRLCSYCASELAAEAENAA